MLVWQAIQLWWHQRPARLTREQGHLVVVRRSLNSEVTFNLANLTVRKSSDRKLEPNFLRNELTAHALLPEHTPRILDHGRLDSHNYVVTRYYPSKRVITWQDWPSQLQTLTAVFATLYRGHHLTQYRAEDYIAQLNEQFKHLPDSIQYLRSELTSVARLFQASVLKYLKPNLILATTFAHGDLVPNNIIDAGHTFYICDWSNGGEHTILYDLMIQSFYSPQAKAWQDFDSIDFVTTHDPTVFHGWSASSVRIVQQTYGLTLTNDHVRLALLICLAEAAIKNFLRHQSAAEQAEGAKVLYTIEQIYTTILA